jgi:DNA-binding CsgD family transcriptional regulator
LYESYNQKGDYQRALEYHVLYKEISDQLFDEEKSRQLTEMQTKYETEKKELENQKLRQELEFKKKELANYASNLSKTKKLIEKLQAEIKEHAQNHPATDELIIHLKKILKKHVDWSLFEAKFDQLHPNFIKNLTTQYPRLTRQETKVCALIKLKLSVTEIADILYITPRSVKKYRHRIRTKIGLSSRIKLNHFINNF